MRSRRRCRRSASRSKASRIPAKALGAFTIARIVEAKKHPNADKLQVVQVEVAKGQPLMEVVCGAPNARAGMLGVFAPLGTYIPGSKITLEKKPVRGVVSNGMMCSAAELSFRTRAKASSTSGGMGRARSANATSTCRPQRSSLRSEADAEPTGLHGRARHCPRPGGGWARHIEA